MHIPGAHEASALYRHWEEGTTTGVVRDVASGEIPGMDPEEDPLVVWRHGQSMYPLT